MFKVIWDAENNGVRLTMSSKGDALNVSPRPVFWEELDLLGLNKKGWIYPHVEEPLLWACDRRYFYKGDFASFNPILTRSGKYSKKNPNEINFFSQSFNCPRPCGWKITEE